MEPKAGSKKLRVGVLMGGWSTERAVSLVSGGMVAEGLRAAGFTPVPLDLRAADRRERKLAARLKAARLDAAFIALHGGWGENGGAQELLGRLRIPYTGSGPLACGLAMQKACAKLVFEANRIPTAPWQALERKADNGRRGREVSLAPPLVVKPADGGSAIGVSILRDRRGLDAALALAFKTSRWVLVEKFIAGMEVTAGVLEGKALPLIEIVPKNDFYDYDAKYTPGRSTHILPARLSARTAKKVRALALAAGKALGCRDFYRVDVIVPKKGDPQVLEVNTVPGMTATSLFPEAAAKAGTPFPKLLKRLVALALGRKGRD
ncbi:MAG TPA: D-alanine--D-alanine ligase [bacterium]|nr:D-alanine--D-alanine ligase [bacterium]